MTLADRYSRQRLISWWNQDRVRATTVLVGGVGALGNEVLKALALLGVGRLVAIDFDRVERTNLSRTVLFRAEDEGQSKAEVAGAALRRLNPDVEVQALNADLFHDVGLGRYRHCTLAIGCVDSLAARAQMGLCSVLAGVPFLDGGMWALGGEARWFFAGDGPCFDCTLTGSDRDRLKERLACSGYATGAEPGQPMAALATTATIIGGLLAQEAVKYACGQPVSAGRAIVYNGQALTLHRAELRREPTCRSSHFAYRHVNQRPWRAETLTPRLLLNDVRQHPGDAELVLEVGDSGPVLELGRDLLVDFCCPGCGQRQEVFRPRGAVTEQECVCPSCGAIRSGEVLTTVDETSFLVDVPLARLGVPRGEVLAVRSGRGLWLYELSGDL